MSAAPLTFTIGVRDFDTFLLPEAARDVASEAFAAAVADFFREAFGGSGAATVSVDADLIRVSWNADASASPLDRVLAVLKGGRLKEGVQLLRLLLTREPNNPDLHFNLGVALNELGRFEEAVPSLRQAIENDPSHGHAPVALAVALSRTDHNDEAVEVLQGVVKRNPEDLWGRLNLGATLLKAGRADEAIKQLEIVIRRHPDNVRAWLGLGDAFRAESRKKYAEAAYHRVLELDPHGQAGELARQGLSKLAHASFRGGTSSGPRPDALEYCVAALKEFRKRPPEEVQRIVMELTQLGSRGLDTNNPEPMHELSALPGKRSGLEIVCWLYSGIQQVAPGTDIGFDLREEFDAAKALLGDG
jgi:tetratricopeptide (TPR) repeat protein